MLGVKQECIKYHFLSLWYDSTWDGTLVSRTICEHSTHLAMNKLPKKDAKNSWTIFYPIITNYHVWHWVYAKRYCNKYKQSAGVNINSYYALSKVLINPGRWVKFRSLQSLRDRSVVLVSVELVWTNIVALTTIHHVVQVVFLSQGGE